MRSDRCNHCFLSATQFILVAAALTAVAMLCARPAQAALVGYWPFDGNAQDASGTGNHGALNGNAGFSGSVPAAIGSGQSLSVDGTGDFVNVPANASLDSSTFTLSYWVNQNGAVQDGGFERVTSRGGDTFETAVSNTGQLSYYNGAWNGTGQNVPGSGWTHVAWVNGADMKLYVNGSLAFTGGADAANGGHMNIGARHNGGEGFQGSIDDAALYNHAVSAAGVKLMAAGVAADAFSETMVVSNTTDWTLSTVSTDGGPGGTWTAGAIVPPGAATFTLTPSVTGAAHLVAAANLIGMGAQPINADNNVRYYRSTFTLNAFDEIAADLTLGTDNGAAIFINGIEVARETSFLVDNWTNPLPSLVIAPDGTITNVVKFDSTAGSFTGFQVGLNEIIIAVRNPNSEGPGAGGFAFKLNVATTQAIPEPATALLGVLGLAVLGRRRRMA